ncbi:MAG: ATP synthase subunit I [Clostridia bacterium]|nr:ATP synthase subunit I [Clostridia bacterium]
MEFFRKIDPTVKKETKYIALMVVILTVLMEAVFLVLRRWDMTVLWGGLLGACVAILNFFLMGFTVQKAVEKEEKDAKQLMKVSQSGRMMMQLAFAAIAAALPGAFNLIAALLPLLFPRIGVMLRSVVLKNKGE